MSIEIPQSSFRALAEHLELLNERELVLVVHVLLDLGIMVTKATGGFIFESALTYAKRRVVEELQKTLKKKGS